MCIVFQFLSRRIKAENEVLRKWLIESEVSFENLTDQVIRSNPHRCQKTMIRIRDMSTSKQMNAQKLMDVSKATSPVSVFWIASFRQLDLK